MYTYLIYICYQRINILKPEHATTSNLIPDIFELGDDHLKVAVAAPDALDSHPAPPDHNRAHRHSFFLCQLLMSLLTCIRDSFIYFGTDFPKNDDIKIFNA